MCGVPINVESTGWTGREALLDALRNASTMEYVAAEWQLEQVSWKVAQLQFAEVTLLEPHGAGLGL